MMIKSSILIVFVASLFMNCKGSKEIVFESKTSFTIEDIYFQKWVAGVKGGGSGINVHLTFQNLTEKIELQTLYFRGNASPIYSNLNTPNRFIASFITKQNRDIIMDGNTLKESQNTPPEKIPFTLDDNDVVISFTENGTLKYFKVEDIKEKPMVAYPAANTKQ